MKVKAENFIFFSLGFSLLLPHFPTISYGLARMLDVLHLSTVFALTVFAARKGIKYTLSFQLIVLLLSAYVFMILTGWFYGFSTGYTGLSGLSDLYRPLLWFFSLHLGAYMRTRTSLERMLSFLKCMALMSLLMALLQKSGFNILYTFYSGPGHIGSNRATGFCQDFADYSFIQIMGAAVFWMEFERTRKLKSFLLSMLLCFSVILSTSKAGLGVMFAFFLFIFGRFMLSRKTSSVLKISLVFVGILVFTAGYFYVMSNKMFAHELSILIARDTEASPSLSERQKDFIFVYDKIFNTLSLGTFVGFGASSLEEAYIEVACLTVMFRTGLLGFLIYYSIFTVTFRVLYKKYKVLFVLIFCATAMDFAAAMTNRLLGISLFFILVGYLSVETANKNANKILML